MQPPRRARIVALALMLTIVGCAEPGATAAPGSSGSASPSASVAPSASVSPSASATVAPSTLGLAAAKLRLVDVLGQPFFCDPDYYPVAREDETKLAAEHFAEIRSDAATFAAIVARLGLDPGGPFDAARQLAVYRLWKVLRAIQLQPQGEGWSFDVAIGSESKPTAGQRVAGTIAPDGTVAVASRTPAGILTCPICLARGTRIGTPAGPVAVESLRLGDPVWTFDALGRRIAARVVGLGSTPVPTWHRVVRLVLSDGRTLEASPGHPLLDGRPLGALRPGDVVDGALVVAADVVPYDGGATFDLLASGPTGGYVADGIPLGSTIDH